MLDKLKNNLDPSKLKNFILLLNEKMRRPSRLGEKVKPLLAQGKRYGQVFLGKLSTLASAASTNGKAYLNKLQPWLKKTSSFLAHQAQNLKVFTARKTSQFKNFTSSYLQKLITYLKKAVAHLKTLSLTFLHKLNPYIAKFISQIKKVLAPVKIRLALLAKKIAPYLEPLRPYYEKAVSFLRKIFMPVRHKITALAAKFWSVAKPQLLKVKPLLQKTKSMFLRAGKLLLQVRALAGKVLHAVRGFRFNLRSRRQQAAFGALGIFLISITVYAFSTVNRAYAVTLNGQKIAVVRDKEKSQQIFRGLLNEQTEKVGIKVFTRDKVAYTKTKAKQYQISSLRSLEKKLDSKITYLADATEVLVNNRPEFIVKDRATGEKVLDDLKNYYLGKTKSVKIESLQFEEKIAFANRVVSIKELITPEKAIPLIVRGRNKAITYKVQEGDSLWLIARKNDTRVAVLKEANPALKGENLHIGDVLNLTKITPLINVLMKATVVKEEQIAYGITVVRNSKLEYGKENVKQQGVAGKKEVTYNLVMKNGHVVSQKILLQKVLANPSPKIVERGSNYTIASRGGGGSGNLSWPIRGRINSPFGRRWGRMHTGVDLEGSTGQGFYAADDGVVVFSGWDGGYGRVIRINHGNGMTTVYSHNSSNLVGVGQRVSRGQLIGRVGATGRATGSHLHFEVVVGGVPRNPLKYL